MKNNYIGQAWLVLLLALAFGAALAAMQIKLGGRIEQNKEADARTQIPDLVFAPGAEPPAFDVEKMTVEVTAGPRTVPYQTYKVTSADSGELLGWVVKARGNGFADVIEVLIGLSPDASEITGLYVLEQKETPGLGDNITGDAWRGQFVGKSALTPVEIYKGTDSEPKNGVEAVTGATISSDSVAGIVNQTVERVRPELK